MSTLAAQATTALIAEIKDVLQYVGGSVEENYNPIHTTTTQTASGPVVTTLMTAGVPSAKRFYSRLEFVLPQRGFTEIRVSRGWCFRKEIVVPAKNKFMPDGRMIATVSVDPDSSTAVIIRLECRTSAGLEG